MAASLTDHIEANRHRSRNALESTLRDWWHSDYTPGDWTIRAHPASLMVTEVSWCPDYRTQRGAQRRDTDYGPFELVEDESCEPWTEFHIERRPYHVEGVL